MNKLNMLSLLMNLSVKEATNKTEIIIAKTILDHLSSISTISSEELAKLSNTSTASITRFVRKFPVKSYREFVAMLDANYQHFSLARKINREKIEDVGLEGIVDYLKLRYETNLNENTINDAQITALLQSIQYANSVTFIGATRSLEIFTKVQLALLKHHKKASIFKQEAMLKEHLTHLTSDDLVIVVSLQDRYYNTFGIDHMEYIKNHHIPCILISQNRHLDEKRFKQVLYFGKDNDWNYGYYSMIMLANHLESKIACYDLNV